MREAGNAMQGRWDINQAAADELGNSLGNVAMAVHEKDAGLISEYNKAVQAKLDAMTKAGDFHNMSKEIRKLANDYTIRVQPALEERAAIEKDIAGIRARTDMSVQDQQRAIDDINMGYQGVQYDEKGIPIKKTYASRLYSGTADANAIALDLVKGWNAANTGITKEEVMNTLPAALKGDPRLIAYKQDMLDINGRKYAAQVKSGQMTQEQMNQQLLKDDVDFEANIIKPAIDFAVEKTWFKNYIKPKKDDSKSGSTMGEGAIISTGTTPALDVGTANLKEHGKKVDELRTSIAREPDPKKKADMELELRGVQQEVSYKIQEVLPEFEDTVDRYYRMYEDNKTYNKGDAPLTREQFKEILVSNIYDDPDYKMKVTDVLGDAVNENNPAIRRATKKLKKEIEKGTKKLSTEREATIFYGTEGSEAMRSFTGEYNKFTTENFSENVENYTVQYKGNELQANEYLNELKRDATKDKVYLSSMYKDGNFQKVLEVTIPGGEKSKAPKKQSVFIAPKDQAAYIADMIKAAREFLRDKTNESNQAQGVQLAAAVTFAPMVERSGFGRQAYGKLQGFEVERDGKTYEIGYEREEDSDVYNLYLVDPEDNSFVAQYTDKSGEPVRAANANDLQMKLFMNTPEVWTRF
jgi:hypothetical protein